MFNYISNGKINLTGCSGVFKSVNFATRYKKGDIVFLKKKAINGTLESIAIKDIRILGGKFSFNQVSAIYTDTYNFLYNADELVLLGEALYLKETYCAPKRIIKYTSNVKLKLNSCNGYNPQPQITTKFKVGDIVYLKNKAKKGKIEGIFIQEIKIINQASCSFVNAIYIDNLNFFYNEDELVTLEDAVYVKNEYCFINSNFKYTSNIKLNLNSCNGYNPQPQITTKFQIGDIVFLKKKANIGILESIFVKNIKKTNEVKCNFINAIYIDNTNFYYNENELVAESEAKIIIKNYVIEKIQSLNQSKITCNISKNVVAKCKG